MTSKEGWLPMGGSFQWMKNIGYKVPLILVSVLLLVTLWGSPPPSFLSYSSLSASQIQIFLSTPASHEYIPPANTSSDSEPVIPTAHTDSPVAEQDSEPKKGPIEDVTPDLQQSASPVNNTTINWINATSDIFAEEDTTLNPINATSGVFAEEDTQMVDEKAVEVQPAEEKYIIPLLSFQVGTGNQLMEYKSAATVARTLNRTLCLVPFFRGPSRHAGQLADRNYGLNMEDRYDPEVLSTYVKVMSMDECVQKCQSRLDDFWQLRHHRAGLPQWDRWFNDTPKYSSDYNQQYNKWGSTADVAAALEERNDAKCVGLGGLWPGLQWRGSLYAASTYMQHSKKIMKAADLVQNRAWGSNDPNYISVHWRFEEANCRAHPLGLCFPRCGDGAVIANGRPSETWNNMTREGNKQSRKGGFNGVFVSRDDISGAIYDRAVEHGVHNLYLSTDGWLRGPESAGILRLVVEDLRNKGLNVAGLWMVEGLPNFADGFYVHAAEMPDLFGIDASEVVSSHMVALVEQELCLRASVFVGSGQSSWSLAVATTRRGRRWKQEFAGQLSGLSLSTPPEVMEQAVIDKILTIQWTKVEDEAPDSWLDYDSCEDRLLRGVGQCRRITT